MDGFEKNVSGRRAYRLGIDASIWFQHASTSKTQGHTGENPELQNILFKFKSLAGDPVIPLFVFDGHERPKVKRKSKMGKAGSHHLTKGMKKLINIFGWQWVMARGEELAQINANGEIDAVMTDDIDAFLFGAKTVIKNKSVNISGNQAHPARDLNGKTSAHHVNIYTADAIQRKTGLTRAGLILFGLLCGGDYDEGVRGCGPKIASGLAQLGYGNFGLTSSASPIISTHFSLRRRDTTLILPNTFPDLAILDAYVNPVWHLNTARVWDNGELNITSLAGFCEANFKEWGTQSLIISRFRTLIWEAAVIRVLRRAALKADTKEKARRLLSGEDHRTIRGLLRPSRQDAVGTPTSLVQRYLTMTTKTSEDVEKRRRDVFVNQAPSQSYTSTSQSQPRYIPDVNPLITKIVGARRHVSTDKLLEFCVEISPIQLVELAKKGIKGTHYDDGTTSIRGETQKETPQPDSTLRMWIPAGLMHQVHPGLVEDYTAIEEERERKKNAKGKGKGKGRAREDSDGEEEERPAPSMPRVSPPPIPGPSRDPFQARPRPPRPPNDTFESTRSAPYHLINHQDPSMYDEPPTLGWSPATLSDGLLWFTFPDPNSDLPDDEMFVQNDCIYEPNEDDDDVPATRRASTSTFRPNYDDNVLKIDDDDFANIDGTREELYMMDMDPEPRRD
ncbi:hypothetical protein CPB85DRAFT_1443135 [Mucidula mucida]|nr:hypothetical protein CPB85DRAFT_1443135 [Mucidula mucida]